jgi:hypothetical protein
VYVNKTVGIKYCLTQLFTRNYTHSAFLYLRPDDGWYGRNNCRLASSLINFLVNSCVRHYFIHTILVRIESIRTFPNELTNWRRACYENIILVDVQLARSYLPLAEPKISLPYIYIYIYIYTQQHRTDLCPEPNESISDLSALLKVQFSIILAVTRRGFKWFVCFRFCPKNYSDYFLHATCPTDLIFGWYDLEPG